MARSKQYADEHKPYVVKLGFKQWGTRWWSEQHQTWCEGRVYPTRAEALEIIRTDYSRRGER